MSPLSRRLILRMAALCTIGATTACSTAPPAPVLRDSMRLPWTQSDTPHTLGDASAEVVPGVSYSQDGGMLVTAGGDSIKFWDMTSGRLTNTIPLKSKARYLTLGNKILVTTTLNGVVDVWDIPTRQKVRSITESTPNYELVALTGNDKTLAVCHRNASLHTFVPDGGNATNTWLGALGQIRAMAISPDGTHLATSDKEKVVIWDTKTERLPLKTLQGHTAAVTSLAFSPNGTMLVSGSEDKTARLWDVGNGAEKQVLKGHTGAITAVNVGPRNDTVATGGDDQMVIIWDAETGQAKNTLNSKAKITSVAINPRDGKTVAAGRHDGFVQIFNIAGADNFDKLSLTDSRHVLTMKGTEAMKERAPD